MFGCFCRTSAYSRSSLVFSERLRINSQNWGSFSAISRKFLPHFRSCCKRIWGMWQTHLGYVANASGSCGKRIWVMLQTHLGHVSAAFWASMGFPSGCYGLSLRMLWAFPQDVMGFPSNLPPRSDTPRFFLECIYKTRIRCRLK